jgi:hypothetical protein
MTTLPIVARRGAVLLATALTLTVASQPAAAAPRATSTAKVVAFHHAMDQLWTDHVTWTRLVIVDFASGAPSLKPDLARLLRNQDQIGNAIKPFYGAAAGTALTKLLRTHIQQAVRVLTYAKSGDQAKLKAALAAWHANADQMAAFLSKANPKAWPLPMMRDMMKTHLDLTTDEAVAQLQGRWTAGITAYDRVRSEILDMSAMLADGIVTAFPQRFAA